MNTLLDELWPLIVGNDWQVYSGLLAVPKFARLAMRDLVGWRKRLIVKVVSDKMTCYTLAGKLHQDDDLPAAVRNDGAKYWMRYGFPYRTGGLPTLEADDVQMWFDQDKKCHRDGDLPAVIWLDYRQEWWQHGKIHRDGDLPAAISNDQTKYWLADGKYHRDGDLPAIVTANSQSWYRCGKLHRDGGQPAVIFENGACEWWVDGERQPDK